MKPHYPVDIQCFSSISHHPHHHHHQYILTARISLTLQIISQCPCILVVNLLVVNQYKLLSPTNRCLLVYTTRTGQLSRRSICNIHIYIYIYIYIYLLIYYLPAFTVSRKKKKKPCQEQEIKIWRITAWGKRKNIIGLKERKGQPCHTSWKKSRDMQSVGQKKNKTHCQHCNTTITRVLNMSGANYKINLNRKSEFSF